MSEEKEEEPRYVSYRWKEIDLLIGEITIWAYNEKDKKKLEDMVKRNIESDGKVIIGENGFSIPARKIKINVVT